MSGKTSSSRNIARFPLYLVGSGAQRFLDEALVGFDFIVVIWFV